MTNKERIFAKELDTLYRSLPLPLFASWFNALFLAAILHNHLTPSTLLLWIFANTLITILRYGSYFYYRRVSEIQSTKNLYRIYVAGLFFSASLWGLSSLFLLSGSLAYGLIVVFIAGGMAAGALGSVTYRFETYLAYNLIVLIPFISVLTLHPSQEFNIMGFILILFGAMLLVASKKFHTHFHNSITLQIQQEETLKILAAEKEHIERLNRHLTGEVIAKEQAQTSLEEALKETQQASIAKESFFSAMSHELRTPLNSIIGFSQILSHKKELSPDIISYTEKILFSGKHLLDIVNTILDFSKLRSGKMQPLFTRFTLKEFIDELSIICEPIAQTQEIEILFPSFESETIVADRRMLYQILLNLLSNAIKFSPKRDRVKLIYHTDNDNHRFTLCDHGPGIDTQMQGIIFDPFIQINNLNGLNPQGTGLGLAIVKEMIEVQGGRIWVESTLGKGSCFHLSIPFRSPDA